MGLWRKIKKAVKTAVRVVANVVRGVVRAALRVVLEIIHRIINFVILIFNYGGERRMRLHIVILRDPAKKAPLVTVQDAEASFQRTVTILKNRANVRVTGFGKPYITALQEDAPSPALDVISGAGYFKTEWGAAGAFFSGHVAGWNVVPLSFTYPVTVFVVQSITEWPSGNTKVGASFGPLADYIVLTPGGLMDANTMAHELGHTCILLRHRKDRLNLMYPDSSRDTNLTGWQKFWLRSSRYVNIY